MRRPAAYPLFALLLLLGSCTAQPSDVHESRFIMGTLVQFTVSGASGDKALAAIRAAADEMQRIEDVFTIYGNKPNVVKAFNASTPGTPVSLPEEVDRLLVDSLEVQQQSGGAFTPLIGSLSLLWGFSLPQPPASPPSAAAIAAARNGAERRLLVRTGEEDWKRLSDQTMLDFGAIAKGYAIDRGMEVLRAHGIANAILDAGGDLRVIGKHGGKPWRIGLRDPRHAGEALGWFEASGDISIVTSGDYERFFIYQGRRYQHILDPASGLPADQSRSATVIAHSATLADAWSTALFVLGAKGLPLLGKRGMQGVLVDAQGKLHQSGRKLLVFHSANP